MIGQDFALQQCRTSSTALQYDKTTVVPVQYSFVRTNKHVTHQSDVEEVPSWPLSFLVILCILISCHLVFISFPAVIVDCESLYLYAMIHERAVLRELRLSNIKSSQDFIFMGSWGSVASRQRQDRQVKTT
jgi:hypothetical protein